MKINMYHELPHMHQCKQRAADGVGQQDAFSPQASKYQPPEEHLLHKGRQKHHDQNRHVGGGVDLGGDGGIVEVGAVAHQQVRQAVDQLVESVEGHQPARHGLAGGAQVVRELPGGPGQKAVENDDAHRKEDVVGQHVLQPVADGHSQEIPRQAEQRPRRKGH